MHDSATAERLKNEAPSPTEEAFSKSYLLGRFAGGLGTHVNLHLDLWEVGAVAEREAFMLLLEMTNGLRDARLRHAKRPDVNLMRPALSKRSDRGEDRLAKDVLHLARHTGHEEHACPVERHREAGRRAHRVRQHIRAFWEVTLLRVRFRHDAPERLELLANAFDHALIAPQSDPACLRGCLRGEVVGGRAETARCDDDAMLLGKAPYQRHDSIEVVVDRRVLGYFETELGELFAQPGSVGVDQLTTSELGADGQDGGGHGGR